jgi:hypothetical protein
MNAVLPDGPTARGVVTSCLVLGFAWVLPMVAREIGGLSRGWECGGRVGQRR